MSAKAHKLVALFFNVLMLIAAISASISGEPLLIGTAVLAAIFSAEASITAKIIGIKEEKE